MAIGLILAALLSIPASAQEGRWNSACFHGLSDGQTAATLPDCESPDLLNTESNLDGTAILKRKGFTKTASLTVATSPVTGSHSFIDSSGNRLDIVCQDRNCAKSTNGNAFATFLTTAGSVGSFPTRWSFVDVGGILYGANDKRDPIMKYDGTTRTSPATMPAGSILALTQDRLAVGDISTLPNRVHYSSAGAYEMFTVGVNPEDSFFDDIGTDGDRIRGIKCIQGNCFIFKTASITLCEMADQYSTRCSVISPNVGTTDPASIVAAGSELYFRAQDKNYWRIGSGGIEQISKKIPNLVKSQSGGLGGGENTNTQTTAADWNAGSQLPASSWNTTTTNGSIFPSSFTFVDTSSTDFSGGSLTNLSLTDLDGSVTLSSTVYEDKWSNGLTSGRLAWSVTVGAFSVPEANYIRCDSNALGTVTIYCSIKTSSASFTSGSWAINYYPQTPNCSYDGASMCAQFRFMENAGGDFYALEIEDTGAGTATQNVNLIKSIAGIESNLSAVQRSLPDHVAYRFEVQRTTDGRFYLIQDGVFLSSTSAQTQISSTVATEMAFNGSSSDLWGGAYYSYKYSSTGSITSRIFDTAFTTPTFGTFGATYTATNSAGEGNVAFYTQTSAVGDGTGFSSIASTSDTLKINSAQNRYVRYRSDFVTYVSTKSPSLAAVSLIAATTGQFRTQCIQPNSSISAWGTLTCSQTIVGNGSEVFYATSAATCAALPTAHPVDAAGAVQSGWTAQTNNATLTIATNTAVYIGWRSLLTSATDQAQVDACVLSWNEGTPTQPAWAAYDSIKNAIYWTTTIGGASSSNRLLKYDRNLEQWYPFDIPAQAPRVINNSLYFGGASSGTWNLYGLVDADAGSAINAYYKTKDFGSDRPFQGKSFKTISVLSRNEGSGSLTGTWTLSNAQSGTYTISLTTGTGISYARSNFNVPFASPQQFMSVKVGNNSAAPFEVLGIGATWSISPWKVEGP